MPQWRKGECGVGFGAIWLASPRPSLSSSAKAGDPVRRGFSVLSLGSLEYWSPAWQAPGDDTHDMIRLRVLATHCARGFANLPCPLNTEGAGKTGCALHPRSRVRFALKSCTRAYRAAENTRPSLRNGFTAYAVLSPETSSLLPPSPRFSSRFSDSLTPATGARTTRLCRTLQSRSSSATSASTATRPTSVTTADAL